MGSEIKYRIISKVTMIKTPLEMNKLKKLLLVVIKNRKRADNPKYFDKLNAATALKKNPVIINRIRIIEGNKTLFSCFSLFK
jgi:hypothetical protein